MQVTFLALYHLLDFGSSFDALLRTSSAKRGWQETMQYGCFGLALAAKRCVCAHMGQSMGGSNRDRHIRPDKGVTQGRECLTACVSDDSFQLEASSFRVGPACL